MVSHEHHDSRPIKVLLDRAEFQRIRYEQKFADFLDLARISNSLAFFNQAYIDYRDDNSPVGMRQRFRANILTIGILHEGLNRIDDLGRDYHDVDYFVKGFGTWISEKRVKHFRHTFIQNVRNQSSFHFDTEVIRTTLSNDFEMDEYVLVSANTEISGHTFFDLAETIEFDYLVKDFKDNAEKLTAIGQRFSMVAYIILNFIKSTDMFMAGILGDLRVQARKVHYDLPRNIDAEDVM